MNDLYDDGFRRPKNKACVPPPEPSHDPCFDEPYEPYEASADGWKALDSRG